MNKLFNRVSTSFLALGLLLAPMAIPVAVYASNVDTCTTITQCAQGGVTDSDPSATPPASATERVTEIAQQVIKIFSYVVGIVSIIMVIVGGFQYVTSGGDSGKVTNAKNTIMYALIGIIIVALSQIMVNFVLEKFTS